MSMKPIYTRLAGALALTGAIAACVPAPQPTPAPEPVATSTPRPAPTPTPQPTYANWMDTPQTTGDWTYRSASGGSIALFGEPQTEARFSMRCDRARGSITLMRAADAGAAVPMRIRTETADRTLTAQPTGGQLPYVAASVQARDPILDAMALTKGRFAVETQGSETLYLPAWAEVTRVIEDCR